MILIMSKSKLCVNFIFLLLSINLIFLPKVHPPKCKFLTKFGLKGPQIASHVFFNLFILSRRMLRFI